MTDEPRSGWTIAGRVVWRLLAFAVAWVLIQGVAESVLSPVWGLFSRIVGEPVPLYPVSSLLGALGGCWAGLRALDSVPWSVLGFDEGVWHARRLLTGFAVGTMAILCTIGALWLIGMVRVEPVTATVGGIVADSWSGTALRLVILLGPAALWEEIAFRGYLYHVAVEATPHATLLSQRLLARLASSAAFGAVHLSNPGAGWQTTAIVILAGWCLALVRERIGLPGAWTAHLAWNWVMAAVLHVPVSGLPFATPGYRTILDGPAWVTGGSWGPEGGVIAALVLGAAAWWSHRSDSFSLPEVSTRS